MDETLSPTVLLLHPDDNVAIARRQLIDGIRIRSDLVAKGLIPPAHKVALRNIRAGEAIRRYGQVIGVATRLIYGGEHVHTHNLAMQSFDRDYAIASEVGETLLIEPRATFMAYDRGNRGKGTRNYIGILTTVNCSATVARGIADKFRKDVFPERLAPYPNVDGVVALTHALGCATDARGEGIDVLRRTLGGYARHPNFASILIVGLGCETNQIEDLVESEGLEPACTMTIQAAGGTAKAIAQGVAEVERLLPLANDIRRTEADASHLIVGLQCGGSDGYSGITANPALGRAVDLLVQNGGTAILSETPEIFGAEHLLTRRAISAEVGRKLLDKVAWWECYCERMGADLNNNPSAGNKAGGLTTILEKSLGAVAKGGTSNLVEVYGYAQRVRARGLVFMDSPGYDPVSATGQVAGGANLLCFTTGRGSAYGCAPTPSIKLSTNSSLWLRQNEDIDLNCGDILNDAKDMEEVSREIFHLMLSTASGRRTKSELHGYGQSEFVPWQLGAIL